MIKRYKYRIYPTKYQKEFLENCFNASRWVWNQFLSASIRYYHHSKKFHYYHEMSSQLTDIKKIDGCEWLNKIPCSALQQSIKRLDATIKNFNNRKCKFPRFKKKKDMQSFNLTQSNFRIKNNRLFVSNFKTEGIKVKWSRILPNSSKSVTIIKEKCGDYYASFVVKFDNIKPIKKSKNCIALDLGIKTFVVDSNGNEYKLPNFKHFIEKSKKLQHVMRKKKNYSKNREKARLRLAKTHNKIYNIRQDFVNKLARQLINENQVIVVENLDIAGMMKQSSYARGISLQGWGLFINRLESLCNEHEMIFHKVNRYFPSSQICSSCGYKWGKLDTRIRHKTCTECGVTHDRDINAAKNILNEYRSTVGHTASIK